MSDIQLALSDPVMPDEGEVNQVDDSTLKDGESINNWLQDSRDQYFITKSDTTEVNWFKQELIQARTKWSESYMKWSPLGSYICSVHAQGKYFFSGDSPHISIHDTICIYDFQSSIQVSCCLATRILKGFITLLILA